MLKVRNQKAIARLSKKSMQANRLRNVVAIIAIALTATLFTALFTIGGGMMRSMELSTMRQIGTSAHAGYKYLTQAEYDAVKDHPLIKDISYTIIMGRAENPALHKLSVELRYAEDKAAQWGFCEPEIGAMPKGYQEAAVSTAVLDALGLSHELGQQVPLDFTIRGQIYHDTFTVCGIWQSDPIAMAEEVWLSKEYVLDHAPLYTQSYRDRGDGDFSGTINADIFFANSWDIAGKIDRVTTESGFASGQLEEGVNWAYSASEVDGTTILLIITVLLLILAAGYLIIYNVFYISVAQDTRYYGLLKTIGTTGRQLKVLVRRQALRLSAIGIPLGLVIGYLLGVCLMPMILSMTIMADHAAYSASPLIFGGAALFALATVWLSCQKPCRLAASVSPMEALRYNEAAQGHHTSRRSRKVSPYAMAWQNVWRTKKKVLAVILSLSLGIILMNTICTLTNSFDLDKYVENRVISDYNVADPALLHQFQQTNVDDNTLAYFQAMDGITDVLPVYMREAQLPLSEEARERMLDYIQRNSAQWDPEHAASMQQAITEGQTFGGHIYGADRAVLEKLSAQEGIDWDKFASGQYVLIIPPLSWADETEGSTEESFYTPGSTVTLPDGQGDLREYTVLAQGTVPYAAACQHSHRVDLQFILPVSAYTAAYPDDAPMRVLFDVLPGQEDAVQAAVQAYCAESNMDFVSKATYEAEFGSTKLMITAVGGTLGLILGLIGILNFVNAMVTSILSRRRELAMLQSIGMTTRQLLRMLITEGLIYIALTAVIVLTLGLALTWAIVQAAGQLTFFITARLTLWPIGLSLLLLAAIAWAVPVLSFRNVTRQSVVERLRQAQ